MLFLNKKYLGVTLQSNLKWNTHIDNVTSNGNKSFGYLKRNLQISNPEVKSPDVTGTVLDVTPSITTVCVLSDKNA
jgi:hypothetical protein